MADTTTILVTKETRERLGRLGTVDDDMDSIICRLLDEYEKKLKTFTVDK